MHRSRFLCLLQVLVAICVIAFHAQVPRAPTFAAGIELFFLIAGINMARHLDRYDHVLTYARSRVRRLGPEIAVTWCVALLLFFLAWRTRGLALFLVTAPVFAQNLVAQSFYQSSGAFVPYIDRPFLLSPLWFVAALFQLQVCLFAVRRIFTALRPVTLVCGTMACGVLFTLAVTMLAGGAPATLPIQSADLIYRLPFTHLTSASLGVMLGKGLLPRIGRLFPALCAITALAGTWNIASSGGAILRGSFGFPHLMVFHYQYLWGYPLLALTLVSLCDPDGAVARAVQRVRVRPALDRLIETLAALSYGAFVFHGLFLTAGAWIAWLLGWTFRPAMLFVPVVVAAFVTAAGFEWLKAWLRQSFAERGVLAEPNRSI